MTYDVNSQSFTVAELLARVRTRSVVLASSTDWTDAKLLPEVADSLHSFISWAMSQAGGGRLVETYNRSVTAALSSSYRAASEFELPPLCIGDTIEGVTWVSADGQNQQRLGQISENEEPVYDTPSSYGEPQFYALLSGRIRVYPQPDSGGLIRFSYQRRHPEPVIDTTADVGTVLSASDAGSGFVLFTLSGASPISAGGYADLINNQYPYRPLFTSLYCDSGAQCRLYLPFSYLNAVDVAGMRVVRSGQSPYLHLPLELRPALLEHVAAKVMRTIGDLTGAQAADATAGVELSRVMQLLSPRTKQDRPKAVNWSSLMRRGLTGRWGVR